MDKELEKLIEEVNHKIEGRPVGKLGEENEYPLFSVHEEEGNNYILVYDSFERNMRAIPEIGILLDYIKSKGYEVRRN